MDSMLTTAIATVLFIYAFISFIYWSYLSQFRRKLAYTTEPINDFLISLRLGPLSQNLSFISVLILSALISNYPGLPFWRPFMGDNEQLPGTLGKTAGVLLAVLAFITTTTASAVRDRKQGGTYFDRFLSTYLISKSYTSSLLWTPMFKLLTLIVFLHPFVSSSLSTKETDLLFLSISNPRLLGNAIWLSCFIVVGLTLLLNVLSLLRQTFIQLHQPSRLKYDIEKDVQMEAKNEIKNLCLINPGSISWRTKELLASYIKFASSLPNENERNTYFRLTVGSSEWQTAIDELIGELEIKYHRLNDNSRAHQPSSRRIRVWETILHKRASTEKLLRSAQLAMQGRHEAMIEALDSPDVQSLRTKLLNQMIIDASTLGLYVNRSLHTISKEGTEILESYGLISPVDQIPDSHAPAHRIYLRYNRQSDDNTPSVITVTAITYRDLARNIRNELSSKLPLSQRYSIKSLRKIMDCASSIHHESTKMYTLHHLAEALIDALIINRHPDEEIAASELRTLIPGLYSYLNSPSPGESSDNLNTPNPPAVNITIGCIKSQLTPVNLLSPEAYSELLKYVPKDGAATALLYMLLYTSRNGQKVSASILQPFVSALRGHRVLPGDNSNVIYEFASTILNRSSCVSHTLDMSGLQWLFDILNTPIDNELYRDFTIYRNKGHIAIDFTNLVLWRTLAGDRVSSGSRFIRNERNPLDEWEIETAVRSIKDAVKILKKSEMKDEARKLRSSLPNKEYSGDEHPKVPRQTTSVRPLPHLHPRPTLGADRRLSNRQRRRLSHPNQ